MVLPAELGKSARGKVEWIAVGSPGLGPDARGGGSRAGGDGGGRARSTAGRRGSRGARGGGVGASTASSGGRRGRVAGSAGAAAAGQAGAAGALLDGERGRVGDVAVSVGDLERDGGALLKVDVPRVRVARQAVGDVGQGRRRHLSSGNRRAAPSQQRRQLADGTKGLQDVVGLAADPGDRSGL